MTTHTAFIDKIYLVTGGGGFIGLHVAERLHKDGHYVRVADIVPSSAHLNGCSEYLCGNLCDLSFCTMVMENVHTIIHMSANMGGMGTIHEKNDFTIFRENHSMTTNLIEAARKAGVQKFLYASSACVYPESLQVDSAAIALRESDVWENPPPTPQGLYGLEKLQGEILLHQFCGSLEIKIARFHNVYGPGGQWYGGREKAPAAFARKAVAIKLGHDKNPQFEMWGDGSQRRSFIHINDAVDAVLRLLDSNGYKILNVGSDNDITMKELAQVALTSAAVDIDTVTFDYKHSKPTGVASRNSNNSLAFVELEGWKPTISLEDGMKETTLWVESQVKEKLLPLAEPERSQFLSGLRKSSIIDFESEATIFAILLPITSRGTKSQTDCLEYLETFARSLARTTWRDTHSLGGTQFRLKVYLALDDDDTFLLDGTKAETILKAAGICDVIRIVCNFPKGEVCSLWRQCAKRAWKDGCHFISLMGDDVELLDEGWLREITQEFSKMTNTNQSPAGFGCVAFTDISFPGMPTFPVLHRTHMDIFGEVVPECFINQDGDPYLYQLYRRWGCSTMVPSRIRNQLGGSGPARYCKESAIDWTYDTLETATTTTLEWLRLHGYQMEKKLTIDVIIPSHRVQMRFLKPILALRTAQTCSTMWIIIVDDPTSPTIAELEREYGARPDIRIRVNSSNLGASASRNRGMTESAAEWAYFLDDDVTPHPDLLIEAEKVIRSYPEAAGFVGNAQFPRADSVFTAAVHLAGVTYFWDIATKFQEDLPWGVTANLLVRRNIKDGICFDKRFPKTGGGEDIDLCIRKRDWFVKHGKEGFRAAPKAIVTHPWWGGGARSYRRFFMWGKGDGALVTMFPQHCYLDRIPNSAELILYSSILTAFCLLAQLQLLGSIGCSGVLAVLPANILHDLYNHIVGNTPKDPRITFSGLLWIFAIMEGSIIRIVSEGGRLVGQIERGEFEFFGPKERFDWFVGRVGDSPIKNEKANAKQRFVVWMLIVTGIWINCK
ncbi:glycosyltransferase family 2 protein [Ramaria rubella]|nr:glycosyltransferase family 2 protein [Ramaria rubella]